MSTGRIKSPGILHMDRSNTDHALDTHMKLNQNVQYYTTYVTTANI